MIWDTSFFPSPILGQKNEDTRTISVARWAGWLGDFWARSIWASNWFQHSCDTFPEKNWACSDFRKLTSRGLVCGGPVRTKQRKQGVPTLLHHEQHTRGIDQILTKSAQVLTIYVKIIKYMSKKSRNVIFWKWKKTTLHTITQNLL